MNTYPDSDMQYYSKMVLCVEEYKNPEKKNFIEQKGNNDLLMVVNRGYGKGKYKFILIEM